MEFVRIIVNVPYYQLNKVGTYKNHKISRYFSHLIKIIFLFYFRIIFILLFLFIFMFELRIPRLQFKSVFNHWAISAKLFFIK